MCDKRSHPEIFTYLIKWGCAIKKWGCQFRRQSIIYTPLKKMVRWTRVLYIKLKPSHLTSARYILHDHPSNCKFIHVIIFFSKWNGIFFYQCMYSHNIKELFYINSKKISNWEFLLSEWEQLFTSACIAIIIKNCSI